MPVRGTRPASLAALVDHTHAGTFGRLRCCALGGICSLALSLGCSGEGDAGFPFGEAAGPQATSDAGATSESSSTQGHGSTAGGSTTLGTNGGSENESTTGADATATTHPDTTGGTTASTSSTSDTGGSTAGETTSTTGTTAGDDGMGSPGAQPGSGMYSECSMFDACPPLVDPICLSTGPVFGFCTVSCNASNECDPPPGDTTSAICDPTLGYCMLDCVAGSCPSGLDCVVGDLGGGVVSRCLEQ